MRSQCSFKPYLAPIVVVVSLCQGEMKVSKFWINAEGKVTRCVPFWPDGMINGWDSGQVEDPKKHGIRITPDHVEWKGFTLSRHTGGIINHYEEEMSLTVAKPRSTLELGGSITQVSTSDNGKMVLAMVFQTEVEPASKPNRKRVECQYGRSRRAHRFRQYHQQDWILNICHNPDF